MRYAVTERGKQCEVESSGERGLCPDCNSVVIGHNGKFIVKHWKHYNTANCDLWHEPITEWHLLWQNLFPEKFREITITQDKIRHRADLKLSNGLVIEIQNSPIKISEIEKREKFYGKDNMIWILNGHTLASNSQIDSMFERRQFQLTIEIPRYLEKIDEYDFDEFRQIILGRTLLQNILSKCSNYVIKKGCVMTFDFLNNIGLEQLGGRLSSILEDEFRSIYGGTALNAFRFEYRVKIISVENDHYPYIKIIKKHWRKFIDLFSFPVFIDNLVGLENDKLYWYQENKIISKDKFLEKYRQYCY